MISLGNYSAYSFYGATWLPDRLVRCARSRGYRVVELADFGGFRGIVPFSQACDAEGIRPLYGCRLRIDGLGGFRLTVRNEAGYAACNRLISGSINGDVTRASLEELIWNHGDDVWLTLSGHVEHSWHTRISPFQRWMRAWEQWLEIGGESLWVGIGWVNDDERSLQRRIYSTLREQGWERFLAETRGRCEDEAEERSLSILQAIGTLTRLDQIHPSKLPAGKNRLISVHTLNERFKLIPELLKGTQAFANGCHFDFAFGHLYLPADVVAPRETADRRLRYLCLRGIAELYNEARYPWRERPSRAALLGRLNRELEIVSETRYAGYFLIFHEVAAECRRRGIPLLARGSAAGSLICYTLGVANVCPFRFGLSFERFLNRERMKHSKLPDIDLDLPWNRRDEIITWLYERFGEDRVAMIGGVSAFQGRGAVSEVAKALGVPAHEAYSWTKRLPHGTVRKYLKERESYVESRDAAGDERFEEALKHAETLEGLPRHPMMHPCGVIIADRPITEFMPIEPSMKGFMMTQMSMDPVEDLGLLKMDLLGQAGLSVVEDCRWQGGNEIAEELKGKQIESEKGSCEDDKIFQMMRDGQARGVFHIESPAMTSLLKLCRCADIDCLVAAVSVIRPGAANEDKKNQFAKRYLGLESPIYAHPVLKDVLADTYGLLIYEEHILFVANRFAGLDYGTADLLRRILVKKKDRHAMEALESVFYGSARKAGRAEEEIDRVWCELRYFSGYMFNKAHGAAYAVEAYYGCWLKYHYPIPFLAAVLNNQRGFYEPLVYMIEALRYGACFRLPDVQVERPGYFAEEGTIQIPLWQIKGLSEGFCRRHLQARKRAPFRDWEDFVRRVQPTPADGEKLARSGALRCFYSNRHAAVWHAQHWCRPAYRRARSSQQDELFSPGVAGGFRPSSFKEVSLEQAVTWELELLGLPVSMSPYEWWLAPLDTTGTIPIDKLSGYAGMEVEIAGIQVCTRLHRTLKGELMKFISIADATGIAEVTMFPGEYREFGWETSMCEALRFRVLVEWDETESGIMLQVIRVVSQLGKKDENRNDYSFSTR